MSDDTNIRVPAKTQAGRAPTARLVAWMGLALVSFSAIAIAGREAGRVMTTTELIFWRSLVGVVVLGVVYGWQGSGLAAVKTPVLPVHAARAAVHFAAQYAWLYALTLIPLAELFALEFTTPLWVAVLAPLALGERLTAWRLAAAMLGFVGAAIVAEPGLLQGRWQLTLSTGTASAAAAALGFAASMIITKRLTRTDPALRILFWMQVLQGLIAVVILTVVAAQTGQGPVSFSGTMAGSAWAWVVALGLAGLAAHFGQMRAFGLADAIIVAPMDFLRLPLIAGVGAWFYGETLGAGVAVGAGVVIVSNLLNLWPERQR